MRFDWDSKKAVSNSRKHGISFEAAITAFDDPFGLRAPDAKHSTAAESRHWLIGEMDSRKVVVVVFTERGRGPTVRIISARPANRRERKLYEEYKGIPV